MKTTKETFVDKRLPYVASLRRLLDGRSNTVGAELLRLALSQTESGDAESAQQTLDKFVLTVPDLSKEDLAVMQAIRAGLNGKSSRWKSAWWTAALGFFSKFAGVAAWHWIRTLLQNYFRDDPTRFFPEDFCRFGDHYRGRSLALSSARSSSVQVLG